MRHLVIFCKQFALNIFSETTRPRSFIFGIKHCLVDLYQVCSVGDPRFSSIASPRNGLSSALLVILVTNIYIVLVFPGSVAIPDLLTMCPRK